jgi:hypothetical protein
MSEGGMTRAASASIPSSDTMAYPSMRPARGCSVIAHPLTGQAPSGPDQKWAAKGSEYMNSVQPAAMAIITIEQW